LSHRLSLQGIVASEVENIFSMLKEESGDMEICKDIKSIIARIEKNGILYLFDFSMMNYKIGLFLIVY
jgi:hypothetical protein